MITCPRPHHLESEGTVLDVEAPLGSVGAVGVCGSAPPLGALEEGQHSLPAPTGVPHLLPLVIVLPVPIK